MQSMVTKMEDLTDLVKTMKVSPTPQVVDEGVSCGNKRKKTDGMMALPECVPSMTMMMGEDIKMEHDVDVNNILPFPNDTNMMSLEDAATTLLPDLTLSNPSSVGPSSLVPTPVLSRCSSLGVVAPTSSTNDATAAGGVGGEEEDFVEELFHAFATGDDVDTTPLQHPQQQVQQQQQEVVVGEEHPNKPDRQLMKRIEDSLSTIPKTMQEMVANRLIDAIAEGTASISEGEGVATASAAVVGSPSSTSSSVSSPNKENTLQRSSSSSSIIPEGTTTDTTSTEAEKTSIPLPLAIATLKTILADYGLKVMEENKDCGSSSEDAMVHRRLSNKSLPLVPMHA
jgi:hypothetical protein